MKTVSKFDIDIAAISNYLFNEGIENHIQGTQLRINRDSIVANYPDMFPEDAYDALLKDLSETYNERFTYTHRTDDDLYLEQITQLS